MTESANQNFYSKPHSVLMAGVSHAIQSGGGGASNRVRHMRIPSFAKTTAPIPAGEAHKIGNEALATLANYGDVSAVAIKNSQENQTRKTRDDIYNLSENAGVRAGRPNDVAITKNIKLPKASKRHKQSKNKSKSSS